MGAKPVVTSFTSGVINPSQLNSNLDILAEAIADSLDRAGDSDTNNQMSGDLDMGGHQIKNLGSPSTPSEIATRQYVDEAVDAVILEQQFVAFPDVISRVETIAQLRLLEGTFDGQAVQVMGYYAAGDGGGGPVRWWDSASVAVDDGGSVIKPTSVSGAGRWVFSPCGQINVKDFGAIGDGVSDNTLILYRVINYTLSNSVKIFFPKGVYLTDSLSIATTNAGQRISIVGENRATTILRRRVASSDPLLIFGSNPSSTYQGMISMSGMTIDGGSRTNGPTMVAYDIVRSTFSDNIFSGGSDAVHLYGGISVRFNDSLFEMAKRGFVAEKFTSAAGGGWPNLITINGGEITDNSEWGVWFNDGRGLNLENLDIEINGTADDTATGGVYVGDNIGAESGLLSPGINIRNCWVEGNLGLSAFRTLSGINTVSHSYFVANTATHDIKIEGGQYHLGFSDFDSVKLANLKEDAGADSGNSVIYCVMSGMDYSSLKTFVLTSSQALYNGGTLLRSLSNNNAAIQNGYNSEVTTIVDVTFPSPYTSMPNVFAQLVDSDTTSVTALQVYNVTKTGFTVSKRKVVSGSSTVVSATGSFYWTAIGTKP